MTYDVITYNGERDLFDLRYHILKDVVDQFIVVEFDKTFSGKPKKQTFPDLIYRKLDYHFHTEELYSKYQEMAEQSPNTQGAEHWKLEFMQKESIKDALVGLKDDDIVFIGDCDEIWNPDRNYALSPSKLLMKVYTYYLNNRSSEQFRGTFLAQYKDIKGACLNHLRSNTELTQIGGWHFTSMGGYDAVRKKLSDSYTRDSYWTEEVENMLGENIEQGRDFLGRNFTYTQDEVDLPQYLRDNRAKYAHLFR